MLQKLYRLKEKELKKVLMYKKPFFSYGIVLNVAKTKNQLNRFGVVIPAKVVKNNVHRVFFRRLFYKMVENMLHEWSSDFVFVIKKTIQLDKNNQESITNFTKDILFLLKKWRESVKE